MIPLFKVGMSPEVSRMPAAVLESAFIGARATG